MTGHIRQRTPGAWEIRYFLGVDPGTGKRRYATATVRGGRKDADKELRRLLRARDIGEAVDPNRITMQDWLARWVAATRQEVAPKTHQRYAEIVANFLAPRLGNLQLAKLTPVHISDLLTALSEGGRRDSKPGGLAPQTRRHIFRVLSAALSRAVEQQLVGRNPCDALRRRLPKVERRQMAVLNVNQGAELLDAVCQSHIYWPVLLSLSTGMRRGEALALRWRSVDLDRGTVQVVESLEQVGKSLRFKEPKTGKGRAVTLPGFAIDELRRHKREQAEALLALGVRQTGKSLVCGRADGEPLQPQSLTHEFPRFLGRLGADFPPIRFHDLRHSHATQMLAAGVHPKVAQERLGHSTITTTLDLYSHVSQTMQDDAAQRIDALFRGASSKLSSKER